MNLKVTIADSFDSLAAAGPGAIYFPQSTSAAERAMIMNCPGCGDRSAMTVYPVGTPKPPSPSWEMSGEGANLTLKPSINCIGCCKWHGWLTNGEYHL